MNRDPMLIVPLGDGRSVWGVPIPPDWTTKEILEWVRGERELLGKCR